MFKYLITFVLMATVLFSAVPESQAVYLHNFSCENCHAAGVSLYSSGNSNLCTHCHRSGGDTVTTSDGRSGPVTYFDENDLSNAFGAHNAINAGSGPSEQTSHTWVTFRDVVKEAGATRSVTYYSRYGVSNGKITCSKCHNPHATFVGTLGVNAPPGTNKALRVSESGDAVCQDCHLSWYVSPADAVETHPVGIQLTGPSVKASISDPRVELVNDGSNDLVSCSSCHDVHWSDSDSSTTNGRGGNHGTGDGKLLVSDGPLRTGATREETAQIRSNLCQACHTYALHGRAGGDDAQIGCLDCHGGHSYNGSVPNAYVLNKETPDAVPTRANASLDITTQVSWLSQYPASPASTRYLWADELAGGSATGYCEQCHGDVNSDPIESQTAGGEHSVGNGNDCTACHIHSEPQFSFSVDASAATCGACHGFPPYLNVEGDRDDTVTAGTEGGYAVNYVDPAPGQWDYVNNTVYEKDESKTGHKTHAGAGLNDSANGAVDPGYWYFVGTSGVENCKVCHGPGAGNTNHRQDPGPNPDTFRDVPFSGIALTGGLTPVYHADAGDNCSSTYCHSNGFPRVGPDAPNRNYFAAGATVTTPAWVGNGSTDGFGSITGSASRCSFCHGDDATTMGTRNNSPVHTLHLNNPQINNDCSFCHVDTAISDTTLAAGSTNGKDGTGTHVSGTVEISYPSAGSTLKAALDPLANRDGGAPGAGLNYDVNAGTCAVWCHDPLDNGSTADWDDYTGTTRACDFCHGGLSSDSSPIATGAHSRHVTEANGPQLSCDDCHGAGATTATHGTHLDGQIDYTAPYSAPFSSVCEQCHGYEAGEVLPVWTNPASSDCATCHSGAECGDSFGSPALSPPWFSFATVSGHNRSGSNYPSGNASANSKCEDCHITDSPLHFDGPDGDFLLQGASPNNFPGTYAGNENAFCLNCHGSSPAHLTRSASTATDNIVTHQSKNCIACHNVHGGTNIQMVWESWSEQNNHDISATGKYAASVTFLNTSGADSYDEDDGAVGAADEGAGANDDDICATCHSDSNGTLHNNQEGTDNQGPTGHNIGTDCNGCHSPHDDPTEAFLVTAGTACNQCHGYPPDTGAHGDGTNLHTRVVDPTDPANEDRTDCAYCHPGADIYTLNLVNDQAAGGDRANHGKGRTVRQAAMTANANITFDNNGTPTDQSDDTCTTACHASSLTDGFWTDTTRDGNSGNGLNCNACHFYDAAATPNSANNDNASRPNAALPDNSREISAVHNEHFDKSKACTACHNIESYSGGTGLAHVVAFDFGTGNDLNDGPGIVDNATASQNEATVLGGLGFSPGVADGAGVNNTCSSSGGLGCHASGAPDWDVPIPADSSGCVSCHTNTNDSYNPNSGLHDNDPVGPTVTGESHDGAFDSTADCVTCHTTSPTGTASDHINGSMQSGAAITVTVPGGSYTPGSPGTCTTSCHSVGAAWTYKWTSDAYQGDNVRECNGCHGIYSSLPNSGGWNAGTIHLGSPTRGEKHNDPGTQPYPCNDCHASGAAAVYTFAPWATGQHGDGNLQLNEVTTQAPNNTGWSTVASGGAEYGCNLSCHGDADAGYRFTKSPTIDPPTLVAGDKVEMACSNCHGGTTGTDTNGYWPDDAGAVVDDTTEDNAGAHVIHVLKIAQGYFGQADLAELLTDNAGSTAPYNTWSSDAKQQYLCSFCHGTLGDPLNNVGHGNLTDLPAEVNSMHYMWDATVDANGSWSSAGNGTCSNVNCHNGKTTPAANEWYDTAGNSSCAMCHNDIGSDASHTAHTDSQTNGLGRNITCDDCHKTDTETVSLSTPPALNHIDGTFAVTGTVSFTYTGSYTDVFSNTQGSCGTNDCHNRGYYSGAAMVAPKSAYTWGTAIPGTCSECHDDTDANLSTGSHDVHFGSAVQTITACSDCHTATNTATHMDLEVNFAGAGSNYNGGAPEPISDETFSTCNINSCHNNGKNAATPAYTWNTETGNCNVCHDDTATTLATDLHDEHLNNAATFGIAPACADCHDTGADAGTHAGHVNGTVNLVAGLNYSGTPGSIDVTTATFGSCNTAICHNDGAGSNAPTPAWDDTPSAADNCTLCHGAAAADLFSGSHTTHLSGSVARGPYGDGTPSTDCGECHAANNNNISMGSYATHIDGAIDFVGGDGSLANTTGCDACHGNGSGGGAAAITTAKANWAAGTPVSCESCHGDYDLAVIRATPAPAAAGANYAAVGHGRSSGVTHPPNRACADCHDASTVHVNASTGERRLLTQGGFNFETVGQENDFCNNCHTNVGGMNVHYSNANTSVGADDSDDGLYCYVCHDVHGQSGNDAMIRSTIQGRSVATFADRGAAGSYFTGSFDGVCQTCHSVDEVGHYNRGLSDGHNDTADCSGCHDHSADPGFSVAGGACNLCHNANAGANIWPGDTSGGATRPNRAGKHPQHMAAMLAKGLGEQEACTYCHPYDNGISYEVGNHDDASAPATMPDAATTFFKRIIGGGNDDTTGNQGAVNGSGPGMGCNTIDCHFNNTVTPHWYDDTVAPAAVPITATTVGVTAPGAVKLSWLAPGDDANQVDTTPYVYDVRMSTSPISDDVSFYAAQDVGPLPAAYKQGHPTEMLVEGLSIGTSYYFALKTRDTNGTWSGITSDGPIAPTSDGVVPYFGGVDKADKSDESAMIDVSWKAAEDHTMPITYDVYMVAEGFGNGTGGDIDFTEPPVATGIVDTSIQLNSVDHGVANDTIYHIWVRACDSVTAPGPNCDTNTHLVSATPTAPPNVEKTFPTYYAGSGGTLVTGGYPGLQSETDFEATSLLFTPVGNLTDPTTFFVDTFTIHLRNSSAKNDATVTATAGVSTNGSDFIPFTSAPWNANAADVSKAVTLGGRANRNVSFKILDLAGRDLTTSQRIAIQLSHSAGAGAPLATWGDQTNRGDLTVAERLINSPPSDPVLVASLNADGTTIDMTWTASSDDAVSVDGTVHYDIYGSVNGGTDWNYLVATGIPGATTSYSWNTQISGILNETVDVQIRAGDGYGHTVSTSSGFTIDNTGDNVKPNPVTDLTAEKRAKAGTVWLTWTAPGDDHDNHGRAAQYDVRYRSVSAPGVLEEATWGDAETFTVTGEPYPDFGGNIQTMEVVGLNPLEDYYFAIKTSDEGTPAPNISDISNIAQEQGGPRCGMCHTTAPSVVESVGNHKLHGFTLYDCDHCHDDGVDKPSTYGLDHQDGVLKMGYGPGKAHTAAFYDDTNKRLYYTNNGQPMPSEGGSGDVILYEDNDGGWGGFGDGSYAPVGALPADQIDSGTCVSFGALGVGGCHGPAGTDPDAGGPLPTYDTPTWDAAATLACANCHGNPSRVQSSYNRYFDGHVDAAADPQNPLPAEVPEQILGAPTVDNHGNYLDDGSGTPLERKYIGQHDKHLNYSFRFSKGDSCNLCHEGEYMDKANLDGRHANGLVDVKLDPLGAGQSAYYTENYTGADTPGACFALNNMTCHPASTVEGGTAPVPEWDTNQSFNCVECHTMKGATPSHVTDPDGGVNAADGGWATDPMPGNCTYCHLGGHPLDTVNDTALILVNSSQVGISYRSGGIHLKKVIGGRATMNDASVIDTEAELCWGCHEDNQISEWGADNSAGGGVGNNSVTDPDLDKDSDPATGYAYDFGSLSQTSWVGATWSSAVQPLFDYKTAPVQSTHSTNETGTSTVTGSAYGYSETPDTVDKIRCSNCHDVHNLNLAPGDQSSGAPYLRGTWKSNPYLEDGAPDVNNSYTPQDGSTVAKSYGAVPRGGTNYKEIGGFQIDQNNGNPTAGWSLASSAGLCTLCHGTDVDEMDRRNPTTGIPYDTLWVGSNGHSNAALGGTAKYGANIFTTNIRNPSGAPTGDQTQYGHGEFAGTPVMGYEHMIPAGAGGQVYGYGIRSFSGRSGKGWDVLPFVPDQEGYDAFDWGVSQYNASAVDTGYHAFSCSKCHNPHASRLPKLMITNCLDVNHNTWADAYMTPTAGTANGGGSDTLAAEHASVPVSSAGSAQNCHRYKDRKYGNSTGNGWNVVTPWQEHF